MDTQILDKWSELLLDMGKRNNLINFKDSKSGSVEIIFPDYKNLFSKILHSKGLEVYDPKADDDDYDINDDDSSELKEFISKSNYLERYKTNIKNNQILVYNNSLKPLSALRNIKKKTKNAIDETGVNIAYMAFGFIHWTESENSEYEMKAPLLLVPITILNESSIEPYYIKFIDDDIIVNPTFSYKLKNEYGINLPEFNEDVNIDDYFSEIKIILSKMQWELSEECKISCFSFSKINMYYDLKNNTEKLVANKNIDILLGDNNITSTDNENQSRGNDDIMLHNVVDADSSQEEAIEFAKKGKSFVLQGPPGTGKSQTITNIIAELLNDGKKVLFVSEKLAALNVVYNKLKNAGLEEFCLELHSHKANKKQVVQELNRTIRLQKSQLSERARKEIELKEEYQKELNDYVTELHEKRSTINKSLYKIYEEIASCRSAPDIDFVIENLYNKGDEYIENAEKILLHYVDYTEYVGYDYRHNVWFGYYNPDNSYQARMALKFNLTQFISYINDLQAIDAYIRDKYNINLKNIKDNKEIFNILSYLLQSEFFTNKLFDERKLKETIESLKRLKEYSIILSEAKNNIDNFCNETIYELDGLKIYECLTEKYNKSYLRIFGKEYREIKNNIKICAKKGKKINYKSALEIMRNLSVYQNNFQSFSACEKEIIDLLDDGYKGVETNFDKAIDELAKFSNLLTRCHDFENFTNLTKEQFSDEKKNFIEIKEKYSKLFDKNKEAENNIDSCFNADGFSLFDESLLSLQNKISLCLKNSDKLDKWIEFKKFYNKLKEADLTKYIDFAIDSRIETEQFVAVFKKAFYSQWADNIIHNSNILTEFSRVPHDNAVKQFKEKDELIFRINKAKIKTELSMQRPNLNMISAGSDISMLLREGEKKRKIKSIRTLFSEIGNLILTLKPCLLMSPLSVSTYLDSKTNFDLVIFDEASQIFPQDAVGAIYRGKQLIVVGDSRQMPPSNFFNVTLENEDEEEDITDFESILDLCSASFLQKRLKWHYRSRYEELITFSNKNFYDNDLITFPSAKKAGDGAGVNYYYVDGVFDRKSKTNIEEAHKVVDLIFEHIEKYPDRSLGVVAFSLSQQNLIDKMVSKRRKEDLSKEEFFKSDVEEPFFIKNLETVQGDERDTIIFSIAYAKDSTGKLILNFGPLNKEGGERRLNVAVTRAKCNVCLVTSLHYPDIDLSRTKSEGTRLLREYLDYAENGKIALERSPIVNPYDLYDSEFEMEVCEFLRKNGYCVDTQVGCSSFKIDLALKRPDSSDYVLAIECDGASYHSSKTARDRDRLRQEILERMGWHFYRIWSTDWFRNKRDEKQRLLKAVNEALINENTITETMDEDNLTNYEEEVVIKKVELPKYVKADEFLLSKKYNYNQMHVIVDILDTEAPISEEWLLKRICFLFGRQKVTNVVRQNYGYLIRKYGQQFGIIRSNGFLYVKDKNIPELRIFNGNSLAKREIKDIEIHELAIGLKLFIKENRTVEKNGLYKTICNLLGFSKMGDVSYSRLDEALQIISDEITIKDNIISIKS